MVRTALVIASIIATSVPVLAQTPVVPKPADQTTQDLMEAVGTLTTLQLYQTYLNIGFIADGRAEDVYSDGESVELLGSIVTPLDKVTVQLDKIAKLVSDREDRDAVAKLKKIAGLLKQQGKELEAFWKSGNDADGSKYEATRKKAWEELKPIAGIQK